MEIIIPTFWGYYKDFKLNKSEKDKGTQGVSSNSYFSQDSMVSWPKPKRYSFFFTIFHIPLWTIYPTECLLDVRSCACSDGAPRLMERKTSYQTFIKPMPADPSNGGGSEALEVLGKNN